MSQVYKVALAQISPKLGNVESNLQLHHQYIVEAKREQANLIVFPELGVTGYQLQDLTFDVARRIDHPDIVEITRASEQIDIVFSFIEESESHFFYISSAYASKGKIVHIHRKVYLPSYGMFDENRYAANGNSIEPFETLHGKSGMMICEDAWHTSVPYLLTMQGAVQLIVPASSPGRNVMDADGFGTHTFWRRLLETYAQLFGAHLIFVNRVGYEDGVHFYGGSGVVSPEGRWLTQAGTSQEALVFAEIDPRVTRRARYTTPLLRDERPELLEKHIHLIQRK